jgi:2'-5' RNA ligase
MKRRSVIPSIVLAVISCGAVPGGARTPDAVRPAQATGAPEVKTGNLFSAVMFGETPLGRRWEKLRPEAEKLFPSLKLKAVPDMHVTVIYIGPGWTAEGWPELRRAMAVAFPETYHLTAEIAVFGRANRVVVVEFKGLPESFQAHIRQVKSRLNTSGLKKPETGDAVFRPHVTLAEAVENPPAERQVRELAAFKEWISSRLDLPTLNPVLGPETPVRFMLAGSTRPAPIPEYIEVEAFMKTYLQAGKNRIGPIARP